MTLPSHPLRYLVDRFAGTFISWLMDQEITTLGRLPPKADELRYRVTLAGGQSCVFVIAFADNESPPMSWRMAASLTQLAIRHRTKLCGAVIYVGADAGLGDEGDHWLLCPDGGVSLAWQYHTVHLARLRFDEFLELSHAPLLALLGQIIADEQPRHLPLVMRYLTALPNQKMRDDLLNALFCLIESPEFLRRATNFLDMPTLASLQNTPYLRHIRKTAAAKAGRHYILTTVKHRFNPTVTEYEALSQQLETIADEGKLQAIHTEALQLPHFADFTAQLTVIAATGAD